jgi:hypothetical protein
MRFIFYSTILPGILGLSVCAAIIIPDGSEEVTPIRLFTGTGSMVAIQFLGAWVAAMIKAKRWEKWPKTQKR